MEPSKIIKHVQKMKSDRQLYDTMLNEVKDIYAPSAGDFYSATANTEGDVKNRHIWSQKGPLAAERLAQVLYSTVTPVHEQFFTLVPAGTDVSADMKMWWKDATETLSTYMANSNLARTAVQTLRGEIYYGTAASYVTFEKGKLVYKSYYPQDSWIDTDYDDDVSTLVTEKRCSAKQLVDKYGKQCSTVIQERAASDNLCHKDNIVVYNYFVEDGGVWKLFIVEEKSKHIITTYSYTSKPFQVARWSANNYEKYGRSPAIQALPTVQTLNQIERTAVRQCEKIVDPVIAMPYDSNGEAYDMAYDTEAGGIIEVMRDANGGITLPQAVQLGGDMKTAEWIINRFNTVVDEMFYIDVLTLIMDMSAQATATQINSANAEKLDLIVPIIIQLLSDYVKPNVERSFQLLLDNGIIPPPPKGVKTFKLEVVDGEHVEDEPEREIDIDYNVEVQSSLIMKMRELKNRMALGTIQTLGQVALIDPASVPTVDLSKLQTHLTVQSSIPSDCIRMGDELDEFNEAVAQAQQEAQAQAMAEKMLKPVDAQKASEDGSIIGAMTE